MARTNGDALVVSVEARLTQIEKSMARAQGITSKGFGAMSKGSAAATTAIERDFNRASKKVDGELSKMSRRAKEFGTSLRGGLLPAFGAGFVGGAVAGLLSELPRLFADTTRSIAAMRGEAAKAGVSFESFQKLKYAADQNGVSVDGLVDALKELQLRADEFVETGGGSAAEAFARLGYGADDLRDKLRDPVSLLDEILKRLDGVDKAAQIRIADELLGGTGGEEFLKFLADGSRGLRELTDEATRVGGVLDEEVGRRAVEIDRQFQRITTTIGTSIKGAIVSVTGELAHWAELLSTIETRSRSSIEGEIADRRAAIEKIQRTPFAPLSGTYVANQNAEIAKLQNELASRTAQSAAAPADISITASTRDKLAGLDDELQTAVKQMVADAKAAGHALVVTSGLRTTAQQRAEWEAALREHGSPAEARKYAAPPGSSRHESGAAVDVAFPTRASREWLAANMGAYGLAAPVPTETPLGNRHAHLELAGSRSGSAAAPRDEAAEAAKRQVEVYRQVTSALDDERAVIGLTAEQTRLYNELRAAGTTLETQQGQVIAEKVRLLYAQQAAQDAVTAAQESGRESAEEMAGAAKSAFGGIISDLRSGATEADVLANALDRVIDRLTEMSLDSLFTPEMFASIVKGLSGAGEPMQLPSGPFARAAGGPVRAGTANRVGEEGPETFVPATSGVIIPNRQAVSASRGAGASGRGRAGGNARVIVNNYSGAPAREERQYGPSGEEMVVVTIGRAMGDGRLDDPLRSRFGAGPRTMALD